MSLSNKNESWDHFTSYSWDGDSYYDRDGSRGHRNEDGSGLYCGYSDEENEDDTDITTIDNKIAALLGFAIGFGAPAYMAYKNAKREEERKEEEKRTVKERIRKEEQKAKQKNR